MRKQIRVVQESPKDSYSNFTRGMEYNTHAKETSNPRVQLIKNMEIDSDGKLSIRRPLVPHKLDGSDWNSAWLTPKGLSVVRVIKAPFRELQIKYLWLCKNDTTNALQLYYKLPGQSPIAVPNTTDPLGLLKDKTYLPYAFVPGEDRMVFLTTGGLYQLKYTIASNFSLEKLDQYIPTINELTELGVNLFSNNPFFIDNIINDSNSLQIKVGSLLPYRSLSTNDDNNLQEFNTQDFRYAIQPTLTDNLVLKALLDIPEIVIRRELINCFTLSADGSEIILKTNIESALKAAISSGDFSDDLLKTNFPSMKWLDETQSQLKPSNGQTHRMPLFVAFMDDLLLKSKWQEIARRDDVFSSPDATLDIGQIALNLGYTIGQRLDMYNLGVSNTPKRKYSFQLSYDATSVGTQIVESILQTPQIESIKFNSSKSSDDGFNSIVLPDLTEALNPQNNKGVMVNYADEAHFGIRVVYNTAQPITGFNLGNSFSTHSVEIDKTTESYKVLGDTSWAAPVDTGTTDYIIKGE